MSEPTLPTTRVFVSFTIDCEEKKKRSLVITDESGIEGDSHEDRKQCVTPLKVGRGIMTTLTF